MTGSVTVNPSPRDRFHMSWEHLHQISQPFSVVFALAGIGVGLAGWMTSRDPLEKYAVVSLLLAGIFAIPAFVTGLAAADVEEARTFVGESATNTHRIWSIWATVALVISATFAGFSLLQPADRRLRRFVIAVSILSAVVVMYAGYLGLLIRHDPEAPSTANLLSFLGSPAAPNALFASAAPLASPVDTTFDWARRVHRDAVVVDGHNDLPYRIRGLGPLDPTRMDLTQRRSDGHTDIPRLREGGVDVQFWAAYVAAEFIDNGATAVALEQIDLIKRLAAAYPADLEMAYSTADIERIVGEGRIASMIGIEGGHAISNSLPVLRELYRSGARYMTLTHSRTLAWADAAGDPPQHGGLTAFGREVVREMNRLGMLVDLSHVTAEAMRDALETAVAPVIYSHSSARAIADHPRNVPDDVLRLVAENGGVVMVNFFSGFVVPESARRIQDIFAVQERLRAEYEDEQAFRKAFTAWLFENVEAGDVEIVADHIEHIIEVAGVDHVGFGSDFDGISVVPHGLEDVSKFPELTVTLAKRGRSEEELRKILGGNLLRVLAEAEEVAERLQETASPGQSRLGFPGLEPQP
jgi:membrane dipeptidase